jgi:hypothetical protein
MPVVLLDSGLNGSSGLSNADIPIFIDAVDASFQKDGPKETGNLPTWEATTAKPEG